LDVIERHGVTIAIDTREQYEWIETHRYVRYGQFNAHQSAYTCDNSPGGTRQENALMIQRRRKKDMKLGVNIVIMDSTAPPSAHIASHDIIQ